MKTLVVATPATPVAKASGTFIFLFLSIFVTMHVRIFSSLEKACVGYISIAMLNLFRVALLY